MARIYFSDEIREYIAANAAGISHNEMIDKLKIFFDFVVTKKQIKDYYHHHNIRAGKNNKRKFSREVITYILEIYKNNNYKKIKDMVNKKFDTNYTENQIISYLKNNHLATGVKKGIPKGTLLVYTEDQIFWIKENQYGISRKELSDKYNLFFNTNTMTPNKMKALCTRLKIANGLSGQFKKGNIPPLKGKKGECPKGSEKGWFKKGNKPKGYRPLGSERYEKTTGWRVKVGEPRVWVTKSRLIWEQAYGPVPKGYVITYKDNDNHNCVLENLVLVTMAQQAYRSRHNLFSNNVEINELAITLAKVNTVMKKIERKMESENAERNN